MNAGTLWRDANLKQRLRLQRFWLPTGVTWSDGAVGTSVTSLFFSELATETSGDLGVATLKCWSSNRAGFESGSHASKACAFLRPWRDGRPAIDSPGRYSTLPKTWGCMHGKTSPFRLWRHGAFTLVALFLRGLRRPRSVAAPMG